MNLFGGEQLLMVVSEELNSTKAVLQRYEKAQKWETVGLPIPVMIGRNGLGWMDKEPKKMEGDGRSPAGVFEIDGVFGYDENHDMIKMPYWHADEQLICIDDVTHPRYNQMVQKDIFPFPQSYENMKRPDEVYRIGAVIGYNRKGEQARGSCIFLHANHADKRATAGCTAMEPESLEEVIKWFDQTKSPVLLQIPQSECGSYQKEFAGIECH